MLDKRTNEVAGTGSIQKPDQRRTNLLCVAKHHVMPWNVHMCVRTDRTYLWRQRLAELALLPT